MFVICCSLRSSYRGEETCTGGENRVFASDGAMRVGQRRRVCARDGEDTAEALVWEQTV